MKITVLTFIFFISILQKAFALDVSWETVKDSSLIIKKESFLDFSSLVNHYPAGKYGQLKIDSNGHFFFPQSKERHKFLIANIAWAIPTGGYPSHKEAKAYAEQLRIQGYNMVRVHFIVEHLMNRQSGNFNFNKEQMDRFFYFLSELKKNGIYWNIDILTLDNGAYGDVKPHHWVNRHDLKTGIYFDDIKREHWKSIVKKFFLQKNPYTGLDTLSDPALAVLNLVNENTLGYLVVSGHAKRYKDKIKNEFNDFLKAKYSSTINLKNAWGKELKNNESLIKRNIEPPKIKWHYRDIQNKKLKLRNFQVFLTKKEIELASWQSSFLKNKGYSGEVSTFNNYTSLYASKSRHSIAWIDMHSYHDNATSFKPGKKIKQVSSISNNYNYLTNLSYFRNLVRANELHKPFTVSEYGQPFWNNYRYEVGLILPALAAFQDWDGIGHFSEGQIDLSFDYPKRAKRKQQIAPHNIGLDPTLRAGEMLSKFLFARGDVSPYTSEVIIDLSNEKWTSDYGTTFLEKEYSMLAFLCGFRINFSNDLHSKTYNESTSILSRIDGKGSSRTRPLNFKFLQSNFNAVKETCLPKDNKTNISQGVYQSQTNEILIDFKKNLFSVTTPKTKALIFKPNNAYRVNGLSVSGATTDGMISISSLDDAPTLNAKSMLLILNTNSRNTGMQLTNNDAELVNIGRLPAVIKKVDLKVELASQADIKLSWLDLVGNVKESTVIKAKNGLVNFDLKNYSDEYGATTFFHIERL